MESSKVVSVQVKALTAVVATSTALQVVPSLAKTYLVSVQPHLPLIGAYPFAQTRQSESEGPEHYLHAPLQVLQVLVPSTYSLSLH